MKVLGDTAAGLIEDWLRKRRRREVAGTAFAGLLSLLLGFAVLVFTSLPLAVVGLLTGGGRSRWRVSDLDSMLLLSTGAIIVALLIAYALTRKDSREDPGWLEPEADERRALLALCVHLIMTGPRLLEASVGLFKQLLHLCRMDIHSAAFVLAILAARDTRISFREICGRLPGMDHASIFRQLREFPGVVFLIKNPAGLSLTADLRQELRELIGATDWETFDSWAQAAADEPTAEPDCPPISRGDGCFEMLGLNPNATLAEAKAAYRRLMKLHHPDRMAGLGSELREIAEENTKALNEAYAQVKEQLRGEEVLR
jgi:hypothetical protein